MRNTSIKRRMSLAAALMMTVMSLTGCGSQTEGDQNAPELYEPAKIKSATVQVEKGNLYNMAELSITVVPDSEKLFFKQGGFLKSVEAVPGDLVQEGDVLAKLDQTDLDKAVANKESTLNYIYSQNSYALKQANLSIDIANLQVTAAAERLDTAKKAYDDALNEAAKQADEKAAALQKATDALTQANAYAESAASSAEAANTAAAAAEAAAEATKVNIQYAPEEVLQATEAAAAARAAATKASMYADQAKASAETAKTAADEAAAAKDAQEAQTAASTAQTAAAKTGEYQASVLEALMDAQSAQADAEAAQAAAQIKAEAAQDLPEEPEDPTNPPEDPTNPPEDPTNPPEDPTNPPEDPTNPPADPTNPPEENSQPPEENSQPPQEGPTANIHGNPGLGLNAKVTLPRPLDLIRPYQQEETPALPQEFDEATKEELDKLNKEIISATYDLQLCQVGVKQAQLSYNQMLSTQSVETNRLSKELADLKASYEGMELKAPFTGRIIEINYYENQWIDAYETVIVIADESQMIIQGAPYNNSALTNAMRIDAFIDQSAYQIEYQAYDPEDYLKRKLSGEELPSLFVLAEGENKSLEFGQSGTVRIYTEISENTLVLPIACLQADSLGRFVYQDVDGVKTKTYVSVGIETTTSIEIVDGLKEGDVVYVGE